MQFLGLDIPEWLIVAGTTNMLFSNALMIVVSGIAAWKRYNWRVAAFAVLNPVYWVLHSISAWRAAWQIVFSPHKWEKTPHGLTVVSARPHHGRLDDRHDHAPQGREPAQCDRKGRVIGV
ncbi:MULTISPECIES: hypothetical protein [unclassified Rathayibacter]|uniref:hypothetical protein n=1 Tax=unclassified Rathayibacter TaxID=2609250 RepID=UPI00195138AC|nr:MULTISPECIES: hypothetical protein [unclassified Rathayibacter]